MADVMRLPVIRLIEQPEGYIDAVAEFVRAMRMGEDDDAPAPFVFPGEISSDVIDTYFTHMHESTLRNFAADAAAGVQLLDSHVNRNLGYGRTIAGLYEATDELQRTLADFAVIPGLNFGGGGPTYASTDDFILAVKARVVRDLSVGFYGGRHICDICHQNYYSWDCAHYAGWEYEIEVDDSAERVISTVEIRDAHLSEVSAVFDGATPGAMILKAERGIEAGDIPAKMARALEAAYRHQLRGAPRSFPTPTEENRMPQETNPTPVVDESRALLVAAGYEGEIANEGDLLRGITWATARLAELAPLADDGRAYRAALIDEVIAEGVRAQGDSFPAESYRSSFADAGLDHLRAMRDSFAAAADAVLPAGRQSGDDGEPAPAPAPKAERELVPDSAFVS